MKKTTLSLTLGLCAVPLLGQQSDKPNILFVAFDDMNDYISPLNGYYEGKVHTPNFERLAKMGVTFTNAMTACPVSSASRLAIMTGISPERTGVLKNEWYHGIRWRNNPAIVENPVLEEYLQDNGYKTIGCGKIYHALSWWKGSHADPGVWDEYFKDATNPLPEWARPDKTFDMMEWKGKMPHDHFACGKLSVADSLTSDNMIVRYAIDKMTRESDKPIFLACGLFRPHMPWEVPAEYFDYYPIDKLKLPRHKDNDLDDAFSHGREHWHQWVLDNDLWKTYVQAYLASISFADAQLGLLLDAYEEGKFGDNTYLVVWSDHGMHMGEKQNWEKFSLWDNSLRVPFFIVTPDSALAGVRYDKPVSTLDIYPTVVEMAGLPVPGHCDGVSLKPLVDGDANFDRPSPVLSSYDFFNVKGEDGESIVGRTIVDERYRYISYSNGFEELYDEKSDPEEYRNLASKARYRKTIERCRAALQEELSNLTEKPYILDTDLGGDTDDILALQMALNYDKQKKLDLKAITTCKGTPLAVDFIRSYMKLNEVEGIPVGYAYENAVNCNQGKYLKGTLEGVIDGERVMPEVEPFDPASKSCEVSYRLMRKVLAEAKPHSVIIGSIGSLTNYALLLKSGPDDISPKAGLELVKEKVDYVCAMCGDFSNFKNVSEWNIRLDIPSARYALENTPVPTYISDWRLGESIVYPYAELVKKFGAAHPAKVAMDLRFTPPHDRFCYDPSVVLFSAERTSDVIFTLSQTGKVKVDDKGMTEFVPDTNGKIRLMDFAKWGKGNAEKWIIQALSNER